MATASDLQQLYVGYFGRAADQEGLNFWLEAINNGGLTLDNVHASFVQSVEYTAMYEGLSSSDLVTQVYLNVLGRAVETEGLAFWSGALNDGTITQDQLIEGLLSGLSANDALIIANKVTVANYYTTQVGAAYGQDDKADSSTILADVTGDLDTVSAALGLVADVVTGGVPNALATALAQLEAAENAQQAYATALQDDNDATDDIADVNAAYGVGGSQRGSDIGDLTTASVAVDGPIFSVNDSAAVTTQKISEATTAAQAAVTTAQNALNTAVGPALINSYNAALATFEAADEAAAAELLNQVGALAKFNAVVGGLSTTASITGETSFTTVGPATVDVIVLDVDNNLVIDSTFATNAPPADLAAANELLAVVQTRVAADTAESNAVSALLAQANLVDAKDDTMDSMDIDGNGVIESGLLVDLADAKTAQTDLAAAAADLAKTDAIIASWAELVGGLEDASTAVTDLDYTIAYVADGETVGVNVSNDVFIFTETDSGNTATIGLGGDDVLFVGTGYSLGVDNAAIAGLQGGNNAALEVFFVLNTVDGVVEAHIETSEFGSNAGVQETNVITLTGVSALNQVAFDANTGFIALV